jgi:hypothetical protein
MILCLAWSNRVHEIESCAVFRDEKSVKSGMMEFWDFVFVYLSLEKFSLQTMLSLAKLL